MKQNLPTNTIIDIQAKEIEIIEGAKMVKDYEKRTKKEAKVHCRTSRKDPHKTVFVCKDAERGAQKVKDYESMNNKFWI